MTAYERYLTREALKVNIQRVEDGRRRIRFISQKFSQDEMKAERDLVEAAEFAVLERNMAAGKNAVPKHNGGNGQ